MKLTHDSQLYLSTNQGCFYTLHPALGRCSVTSTSTTTTSSSKSGSQPAWELLYSSPRKAAITCIQILQTDRQLLPRSRAESATASPVAAAQKRNSRWAAFGDGVGVVTCLEIETSFATQSRVAVSSSHTQGAGFGLHQDSQEQPAVAQDEALPPAQTSSSQASGLNAQASKTRHSALKSQGPVKREHSDQCAPQQPEQQSQSSLTSSPSFTWVAHQGNPVLAIFHPLNFGPRHVFTTSIAGAPMRWWLLPEHTCSSAATNESAETQDPTTSQHTTSSAVAAEQDRSTAGDPHSFLRRACLSAPGPQLSTGHIAPQLLAEVMPIPGRGSQIVAMDGCWLRQLLVCGDMAGNVMAFSIPNLLLQEGPASCEFECACVSDSACGWGCEPECACEVFADDWQDLLLPKVQALNLLVSDCILLCQTQGQDYQR